MNTQLANRIKIFPDHDISSIEGSTINLQSGKTGYEFFTENDLDFSESFSDSNNMEIWNQKLNPVIVMDKAIFNKLDKRSLVILIYDTQGNQYIWGDLENGVRFSATTHLDRYTLNLYRQAILPIF